MNQGGIINSFKKKGVMTILEPGCAYVFNEDLKLSACEKVEIITHQKLADEYERRGLIKKIQ